MFGHLQKWLPPHVSFENLYLYQHGTYFEELRIIAKTCLKNNTQVRPITSSLNLQHIKQDTLINGFTQKAVPESEILEYNIFYKL